MQTTSKITFVGFVLAVSTLSVCAAKASPKMPLNVHTSSNIEYRLSRLTKAIEKRGVSPSNLDTEGDSSMARGFANGRRGGFANGYRGGFGNRHGGGGFVNRSPFRNGGGFYNRY
ncbi:MAG: GrrA/OscA1 family cyclophane-containing rSAM-modified RiPP [Crocosphaera sp.]|jgi:rSAM-associated Gly-rich repeat protein